MFHSHPRFPLEELFRGQVRKMGYFVLCCPGGERKERAEFLGGGELIGRIRKVFLPFGNGSVNER